MNPKHSIKPELKNKAAANKSDKTVKNLIMLLFGISLITSGFNHDEPTHFAGRVHRDEHGHLHLVTVPLMTLIAALMTITIILI